MSGGKMSVVKVKRMWKDFKFKDFILLVKYCCYSATVAAARWGNISESLSSFKLLFSPRKFRKKYLETGLP